MIHKKYIFPFSIGLLCVTSGFLLSIARNITALLVNMVLAFIVFIICTKSNRLKKYRLFLPVLSLSILFFINSLQILCSLYYLPEYLMIHLPTLIKQYLFLSLPGFLMAIGFLLASIALFLNSKQAFCQVKKK